MKSDDRLSVVIRRIHPSGAHEAIIAITDPEVVQATLDALTKSLRMKPNSSDQLKTPRTSQEVRRGVAA
jgi:hypothetical protein